MPNSKAGTTGKTRLVGKKPCLSLANEDEEIEECKQPLKIGPFKTRLKLRQHTVHVPLCPLAGALRLDEQMSLGKVSAIDKQIFFEREHAPKSPKHPL
jgi:hypothetical protein